MVINSQFVGGPKPGMVCWLVKSWGRRLPTPSPPQWRMSDPELNTLFFFRAVFRLRRHLADMGNVHANVGDSHSESEYSSAFL